MATRLTDPDLVTYGTGLVLGTARLSSGELVEIHRSPKTSVWTLYVSQPRPLPPLNHPSAADHGAKYDPVADTLTVEATTLETAEEALLSYLCLTRPSTP